MAYHSLLSEGREGKGREGKEREGKGREGKGRRLLIWLALSMLVFLVIQCTPSGPSILAQGPGLMLQRMAKISGSSEPGGLGLGYARA